MIEENIYFFVGFIFVIINLLDFWFLFIGDMICYKFSEIVFFIVISDDLFVKVSIFFFWFFVFFVFGSNYFFYVLFFLVFEVFC